MFEKIFQQPATDAQKSAIMAAEELIDPKNISMKTRLVDPNSVTALELIMFDAASDVPSAKQILLVEALQREGWTLDEAGAWICNKKWSEVEKEKGKKVWELIDSSDNPAAKLMALVESASAAGGVQLQVDYLRLLRKALGLDITALNDDYIPTTSDYMFFWTNTKKVNNVSWNGKGRLEYLQGLIGSMFLQNETAAAQMQKIAQG